MTGDWWRLVIRLEDQWKSASWFTHRYKYWLCEFSRSVSHSSTVNNHPDIFWFSLCLAGMAWCQMASRFFGSGVANVMSACTALSVCVYQGGTSHLDWISQGRMINFLNYSFAPPRKKQLKNELNCMLGCGKSVIIAYKPSPLMKYIFLLFCYVLASWHCLHLVLSSCLNYLVIQEFCKCKNH